MFLPLVFFWLKLMFYVFLSFQRYKVVFSSSMIRMVHASLGFINILLAVQRSQTIGIAAEDHWLAYLRFFRAIFIQHDIRIGVELQWVDPDCTT